MMQDVTRLEDRMWAFPNPEGGEEIDVLCHHDIQVRVNALDYQQAAIGYQAVHQLGVVSLGERGAVITLKGVGDYHWTVIEEKHKRGLLDRIGERVRMLFRMRPLHAVTFEVEGHAKPAPAQKQDGPYALELEIDSLPQTLVRSALPVPSQDFAEALAAAPFSDPYTQLATLAFQKWEKEFTTRLEFDPSCQITQVGDELVLEHIAPMDARQRALNGQTVAAYRDFLVREYGEEAVRVLEYRYFIDLRKMVEQGQPLCPEHIYRFNVGFNNVEVQDLESLLHRLRDLSAVLQDGNWGERSLEFCLRWYDSIADAQHRFSMREVRGLMRVLRQLTGLRRLPVYVLQAWIAEIESACTSQKLCTLDREHFDQLVRIYWTPAEDWNKIFTGREILHKAIMGFYTTADKDDFKPWLDQHELLQILPQCRDTEDWENFYERLAHVVCKKHMVRAHPDDEWRVGAIIPAPNNLDSQPRWYVVTSVLDDHYGDFHYTLEPATHDSRMPFIQLYRSTASDAYAMNGWSSVEADLSPWTAPGGHNRWIADHHEFPYVKRHTLALWSAYVLKALDHHEKVEGFSPPDKSLPFPRQFVAWHQHVKEWRECLLAYQDSVEQLCETRIRELKAEVEGEALSEEELEELNAQRGVERKQWKKIRAWYQERQEVIPAVWDDMTQRNFERLQRQAAEFATMAEEYREVMLYHAHQSEELPEYKTPSDYAFVGHSLGGALSQGGMYHFTVDYGRVPLPGHKLICFAADGPSLNTGENHAFFAFGDQHQDLFRHFHMRWRVIQQMEYGDLAPIGGHRHLGAVSSEEGRWNDWLDLKIQVFRPLDRAEALEIYDPPTHGRRIGQTAQGIDYELEALTPAQLRDFDSAWFLTPTEQRTWGYAPWISPKVIEGGRRVLGKLELPIRWFNQKVIRRLHPERGDEIRDPNWHFYCALNEEHGIHLD